MAKWSESSLSRAFAACKAPAHLLCPRSSLYTTGEIVRCELGKQVDPAYKPYAYRGLYARAGWDKMRTALERDWQPYLDGKTGFDLALRDLVRDVSH